MKTKLIISKLKSYHIIFFGCILGMILVLNSDSVNEQKLKMKQNKEQIALFNKIISKRKLQAIAPVNPQPEEEEDEGIIITDEVCSHASDELKEYYKTNDLSKIDLDNGAIKCEDKDEDYMKALIEIVKKLVEGDKDDENENTNDGANGGGGGRRNLRHLLDKDTEENIKTYGHRVLALIVFLAFSILSLFGWIICCFCNCCNCCCCCCCKKQGCKIPFFIFTYLFYALVVAVCIYGLTQTNKIFTGLSNTECSFLKFFDEILFGEEKEERPKWVGINGVSDILNNLYDEIIRMRDRHLEDELDINLGYINDERNSFLNSLQTSHLNFYQTDGTTPKDGYCLDYSSNNKYIERESTRIPLDKKYCLDLIKNYGTYDGTKENEEDKYTGYNKRWYLEMSGVDSRATDSLGRAQESFSEILGDKLPEIERGIDKGINKLDKLRKPFDNVYNEISDSIYDFSELANTKGELIVKLVFYCLAFMNVALAVLLLFICMCSGQNCVNCCCCRCLCKLFTHLIWNILALLMIISFLVGSILGLIGRIGGDMMSLLSFILSEENFNKGDDSVLLWKLGDGKDVLRESIVGNGDLSTVFDLSGITTHFNSIRTAKNEIQEHKNTFNSLATNYNAYNTIKSHLEKKIDFTEDTNFIDSSATPTEISLNNIIDLLNTKIGSTSDEKYNKQTGDKNFICTEDNTGSTSSGSTSPNNNLLHPWFCEPIYREWIKNLDNTDTTGIKNYAEITSDAITVLKYASNEKTPDDGNYQSYYDVLTDLKSDYSSYLRTFLDVLDFFDEVTGNIIDIIEDGIGNSNDTFSFLNGHFIKTNLKIVLKYLKYSLGEDIYTVGICLVIVGFSLIFSISSTILLIVIINIDLEKNKKLSQDTEVPNYPVTNDGRVIQFKYD